MENNNTLSSVASPVNAPPLEGLFARVANEETTAVVSPPSNVARDTTATNNDHPSTIGTKMVFQYLSFLRQMKRKIWKMTYQSMTNCKVSSHHLLSCYLHSKTTTMTNL